MFADAAKTKSIERNVVARFDLRDPFNLAALWLEENSDLFADASRWSGPRCPAPARTSSPSTSFP